MRPRRGSRMAACAAVVCLLVLSVVLVLDEVLDEELLLLPAAHGSARIRHSCWLVPVDVPPAEAAALPGMLPSPSRQSY